MQRKFIAVVNKSDGKICELHDSYINVTGLAVFPNKKRAVKWLKESTFCQLNSPVEWLMREKKWRDFWKETLAQFNFVELTRKIS